MMTTQTDRRSHVRFLRDGSYVDFARESANFHFHAAQNPARTARVHGGPPALLEVQRALLLGFPSLSLPSFVIVCPS